MNNQISFRTQYCLCKEENMIGVAEGSEIVIDPAYPNKKIREYLVLHGELPIMNANSCKRFGGDCHSKKEECQKLRIQNYKKY